MSSEIRVLIEEQSTLTGDGSSGILFVVSSPSGGGKGTLIRRVLETNPDLSYSVSYTTRAPRPGEVHGREYCFVSPEEFAEMVSAGDFLESAVVHGSLYGTSRKQVLRETASGRDIILEVDVQGAASVRELPLDSVSIFILPPSFEVLRQRLLARGTESPAAVELRLKKAPEELMEYCKFDYLIVNDDVSNAAAKLTAIVSAERSKRERQERTVQQVIRSFEGL